MDKLAAFIRFCRPHTIIATSLQVTGLFILAVSGAALDLNALVIFYWAWSVAWLPISISSA